ncbi:fusaric acid resistance protein-like domain-containing protein [Trichoderma breve]|uniref:Fusaric acid resistance protein-like domain-containing protein n=1 Tax=Trichoderma breve TaxID=2034170 RepID=A0A9W9BBF7_9HYPO|nr:fusaric acid resistance protein-like domain-containing protein [Trichoderma breve]KAJ4856873.1 fusaric acid resistance protein-like domain-containing protein [Trichoderma breve]
MAPGTTPSSPAIAHPTSNDDTITLSPQPRAAPSRSSQASQDPAKSGCLKRFLNIVIASLARCFDAMSSSTKAALLRFFRWLDSPLGHGVLKCTLAYTIASLATFLTPLSNFLGTLDGKHVVATITVYFHPARSTGSMIEAVLIAVVAIAYAELVSILSMVVSVLVGSVMGLVTLAHVLVVILFIGGGFGFMGWIKQKMANPLVNVGSTLASLAIISVVTKENAVISNVFSNQKIVQVFKMLIMGITSTAAVNVLVWRVSARDLLRTSMAKATTSLGGMLSTISASFLKGVEEEQMSAEFTASSATYAVTYPQMLKNLREAKFEDYLLGRERIYVLQRSTVKAIETLARSIGGLRSAANTQLSLLKLAESDDVPPPLTRFLTVSSLGDFEGISPSSSSPRAAAHVSSRPNSPGQRPSSSARDHDDGPTPSSLFKLFVDLIGPSMEALTQSLVLILRESPLGSAPNYEVPISDELRQSLTEALFQFNVARFDALRQVYNMIEREKSTSRQIQAGLEEVAAACGHFSFSLQTFGEEMQKYLDILDDLKFVNEHNKRSWRWILWWRKDDTEPIRKRDVPRGIPDSMVLRRDTYNWQASPNASKILSAISQSILRFVRKIARDDILFGLKVGIGASLWAMLAFLEDTRDFYNHYRGEWGLLSFMIVCSMTVGASNTTGWARFMGTFFGAFFSLFNWTVSQGNAAALIVLGWLVAFWNFYLIVARGKAPLGRMTILAYNVSTLYAYSLSQRVDDDDDDEGGLHPIMMKIVKHRVISVTAGILWGLIVCRVIWPISARRKFKEGVSMLYLQMGLIWRRGPLAILLRSDCSESYLKSGEQVAMQRYANRLESLRQSAASEFELRGPFPMETYGRIMRSTNRILDSFYAMSLVAHRDRNLSAGERALLEYTATERAVLCDRICHVFQVLASSMMLEYPLTDAVPSVIGIRDRLLAKIFQFRKEHSVEAMRNLGSIPEREVDNGEGSHDAAAAVTPSDAPVNAVVAEEKDYALLYAYTLVTGQVAQELKIAEKEIEKLFGVLSEESPLLV